MKRSTLSALSRSGTSKNNPPLAIANVGTIRVSREAQHWLVDCRGSVGDRESFRPGRPRGVVVVVVVTGRGIIPPRVVIDPCDNCDRNPSLALPMPPGNPSPPSSLSSSSASSVAFYGGGTSRGSPRRNAPLLLPQRDGAHLLRHFHPLDPLLWKVDRHRTSDTTGDPASGRP